MNSAVKLIIGLIVFIAGIYWYAADFVGNNPAVTWVGQSALSALKTVFIGAFGLALIVLGLIIAWIEYEDLRWESKEKKASKKKK